MQNIIISEGFAMLSADGEASGLITVVDNADWCVGAIVTISSDEVPGDLFIISEVIGATKLAVRKLSARNQYGRTPMDAYLVTDNAQISREHQTIRVNPNFTQLQKR